MDFEDFFSIHDEHYEGVLLRLLERDASSEEIADVIAELVSRTGEVRSLEVYRALDVLRDRGWTG